MDTTMGTKIPNFQKLTLNDRQIALTDTIRERAATMANDLQFAMPPSREAELALTHLELAKYYANQAVALTSLDN